MSSKKLRNDFFDAHKDKPTTTHCYLVTIVNKHWGMEYAGTSDTCTNRNKNSNQNVMLLYYKVIQIVSILLLVQSNCAVTSFQSISQPMKRVERWTRQYHQQQQQEGQQWFSSSSISRFSSRSNNNIKIQSTTTSDNDIHENSTGKSLITTKTTTTTRQRRLSTLLPWIQPSSLTSLPVSIGWALEECVTINEVITANRNAIDDEVVVVKNNVDNTKQKYLVHIGWGPFLGMNKGTSTDDYLVSDTTAVNESLLYNTNVTTIVLPYLDNKDTLGSTVWPSSIAGSILCQSPLFQKRMIELSMGSSYSSLSSLSSSNITKPNNMLRILELGCGLGLNGLASIQSITNFYNINYNNDNQNEDSTSLPIEAYLTDNDSMLIDQLQHMYKNDSATVKFDTMDWRDNINDDDSVNDNKTNKFDMIIGADIAYYYYLKIPLLSTMKKFSKIKDSVVVITGQAHRQIQWDVYDAISNGCYNPITDTFNQRWSTSDATTEGDGGGGAKTARTATTAAADTTNTAETKMLLYKLYQTDWKSSSQTDTTTTKTTTTKTPANNATIELSISANTTTTTPTSTTATSAVPSATIQTTTSSSITSNAGIVNIATLIHYPIMIIDDDLSNNDSSSNTQITTTTTPPPARQFKFFTEQYDYIGTSKDRESFYLD